MTARKPEKTTYPDPATLIGPMEAAGLLDCSIDTLSKRIRGDVSRSPDPRIDAVAALFRQSGGTRARIPAAMVYKAAGIDLDTLREYGVKTEAAKTAAANEGTGGSKRWLPTKANLAPLKAMPDDRLRSELDAALEIHTGKTPAMTKAEAIKDILLDRNYPLQGSYKGTPLARLKANSLIRFGDVGSWLASGGSEPWPFIIPADGGRPVNILSANEDQLAGGTYAELDLRTLLYKLSVALAAEHARNEAAEIGVGTTETKVTVGTIRA